jgi:hypothetical protein
VGSNRADQFFPGKQTNADLVRFNFLRFVIKKKEVHGDNEHFCVSSTQLWSVRHQQIDKCLHLVSFSFLTPDTCTRPTLKVESNDREENSKFQSDSPCGCRKSVDYRHSLQRDRCRVECLRSGYPPPTLHPHNLLLTTAPGLLSTCT